MTALLVPTTQLINPHHVKVIFMLAYNNTEAIKTTYVLAAKKHATNNDYRQGFTYLKDGKGSLVGLAAQTAQDPTAKLEHDICVPQSLSYFAEQLFEKLPDGKYQKWPARFFSSIHPGADLQFASNYFTLWLLEEAFPLVYEFPKNPPLQRAASMVTRLLRRQVQGNQSVAPGEWMEVAQQISQTCTSVSNQAVYNPLVQNTVGARIAYAIYYAARVNIMPKCAQHLIICAVNCFIPAEKMADELISILKSLEEGRMRPPANSNRKEARP